jgi:hypothetical protein
MSLSLDALALTWGWLEAAGTLRRAVEVAEAVATGAAALVGAFRVDGRGFCSSRHATKTKNCMHEE